MRYCLYYQAKIEKQFCWLLTSSLRYSEHVAFDRCYDKEQSIFEFFVVPELESVFLSIMQTFEKNGICSKPVQMPNRLLDPHEIV